MTRLAAIGIACATIAIAAACSSQGPDEACDCADHALTVDVPSDLADSASLALSGPACTGATPTCANQTNGCSQYRFTPVAAGNCHVEVDFGSGRVFTSDVTIEDATGACCAGLYASPLSAGTIDVPSPDGG